MTTMILAGVSPVFYGLGWIAVIALIIGLMCWASDSKN